MEDRGSVLEGRAAVWFLPGPMTGVGQQVPLLLAPHSDKIVHYQPLTHRTSDKRTSTLRTNYQILPPLEPGWGDKGSSFCDSVR